jgi:hypothetical protein
MICRSPGIAWLTPLLLSGFGASVSRILVFDGDVGMCNFYKALFEIEWRMLWELKRYLSRFSISHLKLR